MGSKTMKFPGFGLFLLLAYFVPIKAKVIFDANSTRVTDGRLWYMADNKNNIYNFIFEKLREFALKCCENPTYGHSLTGCTGKQIAYWAEVDKRVWDGENDPDKKEDLKDWLDDRYNPEAIYPFDENYAKWLCHGVFDQNGNIIEDGEFPNFSQVLETTNPDGHTEAQLIPRMEIAAKRLSNEKWPANFFLYTQNSPCGSGFPENCQDKIFKFTADFMYDNNRLKYHSLAVGFYYWYIPKYSGIGIQGSRERFCTNIQKEKDEYKSFDFSQGLFFRKIKAQNGDSTYKPPDGKC